MTKRVPKSAAVLTVRGADKFTKRGRKAVAAWLRLQADHLEHNPPHVWNARYTARYLYK